MGRHRRCRQQGGQGRQAQFVRHFVELCCSHGTIVGGFDAYRQLTILYGINSVAKSNEFVKFAAG
jgi:hypothetical protein